MYIKRDKYLNSIKKRMHNGMIKVITGIRRCGKSYLLFHIFKNYLIENGINRNHIIEIELDRYRNKKYRNPATMLEFIDNCIEDEQMYYILLDEVQMLEDFEDVLNELLHYSNIDVYVTGSNAKFLSKDIVTEFRGRGDEIQVHPLSFKEFMSSYSGDVYHGWAEYMVYGGLPYVALLGDDEEQKIKYLTSLFEETYIKDIVERNRVDKVHELGNLVNILASAMGSLTNPNKIEATFKSVIGSDITRNTICQYISYLVDAFVITEANRYDIKGRKYIGAPLKYYFEDIGLRNARLGFRQNEESHLMENIIYNELLIRGYRVDVGVVNSRYRDNEGVQKRVQYEVDFIANLGSKRYYIQSAFALPDAEKVKQEKNSLMHIDNSFKKIIIVKDIVKPYMDEYGITTMSLYDFLLNENSLDLY